MSASGAPVVLLHGVGLDHTMWEPFTSRIARECVALDLPGHGSRPPLRTPQTLASLAADVLARLPDGRFHLVGFSLGALIAQQLARSIPDQLLSLVCVSSVCRRTPLESAQVEKRLQNARDDFTASTEASLQRWYPDGSTVSPAVVDATRRTLSRNDVESFLHAYAVFARGDREIGPRLGEITVPALAVTGQLDPGSTPEMTRRLADAIPGCRAEIIPGAHHMIPVEDTRGLVDVIASFLAQTETSTPSRLEGERRG